jgi:hypothetical protein
MYHEVRAAALPDDRRRNLPLLGNDEIKLCVDARGAMHDFDPLPSYPPPRIVWTGRRHDRRNDRYNSNLFEWGFLGVALDGEESLPAVTGWSQRLAPREGIVVSDVTRGTCVERTTSLVHLEHNLLAIHRRYEGLPAGRTWNARAVYTFCHVGTEEVPYRTTWRPRRAWSQGIAADATADGVTFTRSRIALFSDTPCEARATANRLELAFAVPDCSEFTVYLSLADDLGDDPQLLHIPDAPWMTPPVREINREALDLARTRVKPDPARVTGRLRRWVARQGFGGVLATQRAAWAKVFDGAAVRLPAAEPKLQASLDTQIYTLRCSYSRYSLPANPFNSSWGAAYFWDERYGFEGLLAAGSPEMPERILEWRRRILPFCTLMTAGRGARYVPSATESGSMIADRNVTQFTEFFQMGVFVYDAWLYCRYRDDAAVWRRYYPIIRECAEFYRHWLLVELAGDHLMVVPLTDVDEGRYPVQDGPFTAAAGALALNLAWTLGEKLGIGDDLVPEWKRLGAMALQLAKKANNGSGCYLDFELDRLPVTPTLPDASAVQWRDGWHARHRPANQMDGTSSNVTGETKALPFWSWGYLQQAYLAATQGQPDRAAERLRESLNTMMDFGALNESANLDLTDVHHPWFTTGAGAYLRAVVHMLMIPGEDEIAILPGVPSSWRDLAFTVPAFGGRQVDVKVEDGQVVSLKMTADRPAPEPCRVCIPKRFLRQPEALAPLQVEERGDCWVLAVNAERR